MRKQLSESLLELLFAVVALSTYAAWFYVVHHTRLVTTPDWVAHPSPNTSHVIWAGETAPAGAGAGPGVRPNP